MEWKEKRKVLKNSIDLGNLLTDSTYGTVDFSVRADGLDSLFTQVLSRGRMNSF